MEIIPVRYRGGHSSPLTLSFPVQPLVLHGLFLCGKKIQSRKRNWLLWLGAGQNQVNRENQNKLNLWELGWLIYVDIFLWGKMKILNPQLKCKLWMYALSCLQLHQMELISASPIQKLLLVTSGGSVSLAGLWRLKMSRLPHTVHTKFLLTGSMQSWRKPLRSLALQDLEHISSSAQCLDTFMP